MAFTEEGSWKVGPDGMYDLVFRSGALTLNWEDKCFMELSADDGDSPEDFVFDETDLMWMQCYKPWLAAVVHGKDDVREVFETEDEAKKFLKEKQSQQDEGTRVAYYLVKIDGNYYYEDGNGVLTEKVDPSEF